MNLEPVKVDLAIETTTLDREAFYNLCFITENDVAPRTLEVKTLRDLVENGYEREDLAYNFCVGVFAQQSMPMVYIRAKRTYETYEEAFSADNNDMYYYVVIESKDTEVITNFNDYLVTSDDYKLQFYSSNIPVVEGRKLVHYYLDDDGGGGGRDFYIKKTRDTGGGDGGDTGGGDGEIVCTPTHYTIPLKKGDLGTKTVYAKYRWNEGEWVDWSRTSPYTYDFFSAFSAFFNDLPVEILLTGSTYFGEGETVAFSGSSGDYLGDDYNFHGLTGFPSSGRVPSPKPEDYYYPDETFPVVSQETNILEFKTSEGEGVDLVQEIFGGDYTAISCGRASIQGDD